MFLRVEAEVKPTEDPEKVRKALENIFTLENIRVVERGRYKLIVGESRNIVSLLKFYEIIRRRKILDSVRKVLLRGTVGSYISFKLNKQAAYVGVVSFVDSDQDSSLGPINVFIETKDPRQLIDWLAPKTSRGKPLWEKQMPRDI